MRGGAVLAKGLDGQLVDSSKFGMRSPVQVMGLDEVDLLVIDPVTPQEIVAWLRQEGIDVRLADPFATALDPH